MVVGLVPIRVTTPTNRSDRRFLAPMFRFFWSRRAILQAFGATSSWCGSARAAVAKPDRNREWKFISGEARRAQVAERPVRPGLFMFAAELLDLKSLHRRRLEMPRLRHWSWIPPRKLSTICSSLGCRVRRGTDWRPLERDTAACGVLVSGVKAVRRPGRTVAQPSEASPTRCLGRRIAERNIKLMKSRFFHEPVRDVLVSLLRYPSPLRV